MLLDFFHLCRLLREGFLLSFLRFDVIIAILLNLFLRIQRSFSLIFKLLSSHGFFWWLNKVFKHICFSVWLYDLFFFGLGFLLLWLLFLSFSLLNYLCISIDIILTLNGRDVYWSIFLFFFFSSLLFRLCFLIINMNRLSIFMVCSNGRNVDIWSAFIFNLFLHFFRWLFNYRLSLWLLLPWSSR